jgi:NitT/TauT family transport system ATP-binding protein
MIECQNLYKSFQTQSGVIQALKNVNFSVNGDELVCIVGPSGCGKTTLLKIIAGLVKPTNGRILNKEETHNHHQNNAMVFQEHGLFPWMTLLENVAFGLEMRGMKKKERRERAKVFIEKVGLTAFIDNYPHQLSVGMRQRVGIARAFLINTEMLLMDEPFGSLDSQTKILLQEELVRLWREDPKLILYVTHDIEEALLLADRILVMTGRPGSIRKEIHIPLDRPRDISDLEQPEVREIKYHIWEMLKDEVRKNLWIPV